MESSRNSRASKNSRASRASTKATQKRGTLSRMMGCFGLNCSNNQNQNQNQNHRRLVPGWNHFLTILNILQ